LSARAGVPLATVKYYLRERLLPPGTATATNQATYDDTHVRRLRLIRALIDVGGLGIDEVRRVMRAIEDPRLPLHEVLGAAHYGLASRGARRDLKAPAAMAEVDRLLADLGWHVDRRAPGRARLARALGALQRLGWTVGADSLVPYVRAAEDLAAHEIAMLERGGDRAELVERAVVGTVVFEEIFGALRLLAHEHHSKRRFGGRRVRRGAYPTS
jgi:DNA-binding transcriptional MerR regulator